MKKIFIWLVAAIISFASNLNHIIDKADIIPLEYKNKIAKQIQNLPKNSDIFIVTLNSFEDKTLFEKLKKDIKNSDKKILSLIIYPKQRKIFLVGNSKTNDTLSEKFLDDFIKNNINPYFSHGDFGGGIESGVERLSLVLGDTFDFKGLIPFVLALLLLGLSYKYVLKYFNQKKKYFQFKKIRRQYNRFGTSIFAGLVFGSSIMYFMRLMLLSCFKQYPSLAFEHLLNYIFVFTFLPFTWICIFAIDANMEPKTKNNKKNKRKKK